MERDTSQVTAGSDPIRRLAIRFTGQVQGVCFRWTSRKVAEELGLVGWARNEPDGSVSMELQGPDERIAEYFTLFDEQYKRWPIRYVIDDKEDIAPIAGETGFRVRF